MGLKLSIEITSPMDERDHELLSGIAVMTLAIANHELAEQRFPEAFNQDAGDPESVEAPEEVAVPEPPQPCGALAPAPDGDMICISKAGHRGRHAYRQIPDARVEPLAN
jgi:hypothetical protein